MFIKKEAIARLLAKNIVPILLLTVLFSSVIYIYCLGDTAVFVSLSLFSLLYSTFIFAALEFLKSLKRPLLATVGETLMFVLAVFIGDALIDIPSMTAMGQWFFEPRRFSQVYVGSIQALIIIFGFVIGSSLYYFTRIRFRSVFVFLICMCPFSLFAKSFTDIPVIFTILIVTLFFLLLIIEQVKDVRLKGKNAYIAIGAFIALVTAGAAFFPKLESAPFREEFDSLITGINIASIAEADFNDFSGTSSNTTATTENADKVLLRIYGDNPRLIKRQCFNSYDSVDSVWGYYGDINTGYNYYNKYTRWENPMLIADEFGRSVAAEEKRSLISSEIGNVRAIYTPENMTRIEFMYSSLSDYGLRYVYRTPLDEYFHNNDSGFDSYTVTWYDFNIDKSLMLDVNDEKASGDGRSYTSDYYLAKTEMKEIFDPLMTDEERKACYLNETNYNRIKKLVADITAGCTNDYDKAFAIYSYFKSPQFIYDKEFVPADSSVEYFVFTTKRGICTDYATAMTLMCREAGLYSRYVEGFAVSKYDEETKSYYVTAEDSHAYVQVWLDGYGWTDFDPTSNNIDDGYNDPTFLIVGTIMLLIVLVGVFIFAVRPIVLERRFVSRTGKLRGRKQLVVLYPRISSIIHKELGLKQNVLTIKSLKEAAKANFSADINEISDDFECTVYGDIDCGEKNYLAAYLALRNAISEKKKQSKRKKK